MAIENTSVRVGMEMSGFERGLAKLKGGLKGAQGKVAAASKAMAVGLAAGAAAAGAGMLKATQASLKMAEAMGQVSTLIGGNQVRMRELQNSVNGLALSTGVAASDITDGLYDVISAFGDSADSAKILETAVLAAGAAGSDTKGAVALLSATMKGYGEVNADAAKKVADLAFGTVRLGQTTLPQLSAGLQGMISIASSTGVRMEELFAVMATGTGVMGDASAVGTKLQSFMVQLQKPGAELTEVMKSFGYESGQAWVEGEGLAGVMGQIKNASETSGVSLSKMLRRVEATTFVTELAGASADVYAAKLGELENATGELNTAVTAQRGGLNQLNFQLNRIKQAVGVAVRSLGDKLIKGALKKLGPLFEKIIGHIAGFGKKLDAIQKAAGKVAAHFRNNFAPEIENIKTAFGNLIEVGKSLVKAFVILIDRLRPLFGSAFRFIAGTLADITGIIKRAGQLILDIFRGEWGAAFTSLEGLAAKIASSVGKIFNRMVDVVLGALQSLLSWVPGWGDKIAEWREGLAERMEEMAQAEKENLERIDAVHHVRSLAAQNSYSSDLLAGFGSMWNEIKTTTGGGAAAVEETVQTMVDNSLTTLQGAAREMPAAIRPGLIGPESLVQLGEDSMSGLNTVFDESLGGGGTILSTVFSGLTSMRDFFASKFTGPEGILFMAENLMNGASGLKDLFGTQFNALLSSAGPWGTALMAGYNLFRRFRSRIDREIDNWMRERQKSLEDFRRTANDLTRDEQYGKDAAGRRNPGGTGPSVTGGFGGFGGMTPSEAAARAEGYTGAWDYENDRPAGPVPGARGNNMRVGVPTLPATSLPNLPKSGGAGSGVSQEIAVFLNGAEIAREMLKDLPKEAKMYGVYS